jgi:hypothetical protein
MATQWLNHFVDLRGVWVAGQPEEHQSSEVVTIGGGNVRIHESDRSGSVVMAPAGSTLASYGDPEVFLRVTHRDGAWEYLSAPLHTPVEVANVETLELWVLFWIGQAGCPSVTYRAFVNAHCVYERI